MINPRAIATRGIGYGARSIATAGLSDSGPLAVRQNTSYGADDDDDANFIHDQNRAIVQMVTAFVSSGVFS